MIRTLPVLAALPCLTACDLNDLFSPGKASREAYEYRASITSQPNHIPDAGKMVEPTQVAEIPVPAVVDVPEPVYVTLEPPAPYIPPPRLPDCVYDLYQIFRCIDGEVKPWA